MLPNGGDGLLPAWGGPGRTEDSLHCYDRDRFPIRRLSMATQSNPGFLQTTTGQMTLMAAIAILVVLFAWRYVF